MQPLGNEARNILQRALRRLPLRDLKIRCDNLDGAMKPETNRFRLVPVLAPILALLFLAGCGDKPNQPAAAAAPPVTVAQPTKRTVTDWDEFTGRFEAIEEVQVRARVGGFVTSVEFRDGAF